MRPILARWIGDADALRHLEHFQARQAAIDYAQLRGRFDDYYIALLGELFDRMTEGYSEPTHWARLGGALAQLAEQVTKGVPNIEISANETALFAAAAFYSGGFPASAYLTLKGKQAPESDDVHGACFDLLARPKAVESVLVRSLLGSLRSGDASRLEAAVSQSNARASSALELGPVEWIPARLLQQLLGRFVTTNVRAVLPGGWTAFWNPLVRSFLNRQPPMWEFFPSQMEAIQRSLLESEETFSLQMPTGAGKTALCESILFSHLSRHVGDAAILLVPYRSLASELRGSLVKRLNAMGISARCVYGGTVPTGDEIHGLEDTRALVATPEALSGLLSADAEFLRRTSLVICDEGHLLDNEGRGVSLELLLARLRAREVGSPRFVFVSAIVPNIEEINAWLGGKDETVVRSAYRPAIAEFGRLTVRGSGKRRSVALEMHPHETPDVRFIVDEFLSPLDFHWTKPETGRRNTYDFSTTKTIAIAAARKALPMGVAAVFAANKRGSQGAVGLAEELLEQDRCGLSLPRPISFADAEELGNAAQYLEDEYGSDWVGAKSLRIGAALHHGDLPQETREVIEDLVRRERTHFVICTSTLAEGVNLPIRTLVLYSVQRRVPDGPAEDLRTRDIKNLVGRAGRAGATTKGLVICANANQWSQVEAVALQSAGEPVTGALRQLLIDLREALGGQDGALTNEDLEGEHQLHALIDGIDSTLVDLATEELGQEALVQLALKVADETFAARKIGADLKNLLHRVFTLRAQRVDGIRASGRLGWIRDTGSRVRMIDAVEQGLLPKRPRWDDVTDPIDATVVSAVLEWAWVQPELVRAVRVAYRDVPAEKVQESFFRTVVEWIGGTRFANMAESAGMEMSDLLGVHTSTIGYVLQTLVEQGVALLSKVIEARQGQLSPSVLQLSEHLRFGVPTPVGLGLAAGGVRHRNAAVELGAVLRPSITPDTLFRNARAALVTHSAAWKERLGVLVYGNTLLDLEEAISRNSPDEESE